MAGVLHMIRRWKGLPAMIMGMVLLVSLALRCQAKMVAKSSLEMCQRSGDPTKLGVTCQQKLVVALSVEAGAAGTEQLEVVLDEVQGPDGPQALQRPLALLFSKARPLVVYPIQYLQSVNNKPFEIAVKVDEYFDGIFGGGCKDGFNEAATCGFALDAQGQKIFDSQVQDQIRGMADQWQLTPSSL
jgi:hypothetical protein